MRDRLTLHGIDSLSDLASLTDADAEELEGSAGAAVQCGMRCRPARPGSTRRDRACLGGGHRAPAGRPHGVEMASPPLSIPAGIYQGEFYLESPDEFVEPEVLALPVIMMS